jgi:hypothetical protein
MQSWKGYRKTVTHDLEVLLGCCYRDKCKQRNCSKEKILWNRRGWYVALHTTDAMLAICDELLG